MGRPLTVRPLLLHLQEQREISQVSVKYNMR